ncbi:MAG TPA: ABC transporter substrate-binding protein, partial [bacterium]
MSWQLAVEKYADSDYGAAVVLLQRILQEESSPHESAAWLLLGRSHLHLRHLAEAEEAANQLILRYPHGRYATFANYLRAQIHFLRGDYYGAALELLQAAQASQDDGLSLLARGKLERIFELFLRGDERQRVMAWVKDSEIRAELSAAEQGFRRPYCIGVIMPLSGLQSETGLSILSGVEAACAEARKRMRLDFEVIARDSRGDVVEAIRAAHSLIAEESVLGLIGELDEAACAGVAAVAAEQGTALILPTIREADLAAIGENVYQMMPNYSTEGAAAAVYLIHELKVKKVGILAPASAEGMARVDGFRNSFEKGGGVVAGLQWYHQETADFRPLLARLIQPLFASAPVPEDSSIADSTSSDFFDAQGAIFKESSHTTMSFNALEALYIPVQGEEMALLAPQMALFDFQGVLMGSSDCWNFLSQEATRRYFNGLLFPSVLPDFQGWSSDSEFGRMYRSRTGVIPNRWNALGWDAGSLLAQGFRDTGKLSRAKVVQRL